MRTIYLIRHGEPKERPENCCISQAEECLGEVGTEQGGALAKWRKEHPVTAVFASPQKRCIQTAAFLSETEDLVQIHSELREVSVGEWDGRSFEEIKECWPELYEERGIHPGTTAPPGGESFSQAGERLEEALLEILKETKGNIAVCTHAGILRGWLYQKMKLPETELFSIELPFGSITEVLWDGTEFSIKEVGKKPNNVPGPAEIRSLFQKAETPMKVQEHGKRVAELARKLAEKQIADGAVREDVLRVSCILHDFERTKGRIHPQLAAKRLKKAGYQDVAETIAQHHDLSESPSPEAELLYLADKWIKGTKRISLEERFGAAREKCRDEAAISAWQKRYDDAIRLKNKYGDAECEMERLGGLILAAGLSSRMGMYKPLMEVDGESMIRHVVNMMKEAGASVIVVVTGYRREDLEAHLADDGVEFVFNADYAVTQQLESLKIGLSALQGRCDRIMISPADVPLVHKDTVSRLLQLEGDFIRPLYHGEPGHPVILEQDWLSYVLQYDGPGGLKGAMESSGCRLINFDVEDMGVILDNDTRQDFERLIRWHQNDQ